MCTLEHHENSTTIGNQDIMLLHIHQELYDYTKNTKSFFKFVIAYCPCHLHRPDHGPPELALFCFFWSCLGILIFKTNLARKKMVSIPLSTENPVKRPIVPPMRPSAASNVTFTSRSTLTEALTLAPNTNIAYVSCAVRLNSSQVKKY